MMAIFDKRTKGFHFRNENQNIHYLSNPGFGSSELLISVFILSWHNFFYSIIRWLHLQPLSNSQNSFYCDCLETSRNVLALKSIFTLTGRIFAPTLILNLYYLETLCFYYLVWTFYLLSTSFFGARTGAPQRRKVWYLSLSLSHNCFPCFHLASLMEFDTNNEPKEANTIAYLGRSKLLVYAWEC